MTSWKARRQERREDKRSAVASDQLKPSMPSFLPIAMASRSRRDWALSPQSSGTAAMEERADVHSRIPPHKVGISQTGEP